MLACVMQMRNNTVRADAVDQDDRHRHTHACLRALRADAVNLDDDIEAAKDANRGERRARLLGAHKFLSLALFHFNIYSIQTESLSLSAGWRAADLHNLLLTVSRLHRAGQLFMDRGAEINRCSLYSFPIPFALLQ